MAPPSAEREGVSKKMAEEKIHNGDDFSSNKRAYIARRRELRTHGTAAEAALWSLLKSDQIEGLRWRRQFSIGAYILDFYCPECRLAVELDGEGHYKNEGGQHDRQRDLVLNRDHGIQVLRFENKFVFKRSEEVLSKIRETALCRRKTTRAK